MGCTNKDIINPCLDQGKDEDRGSDCTGTDGALNRVLTLSNARPTNELLVIVQGRILMETQEYTVVHQSGTTITFLVNMDDADYIETIYWY